MLSDGYEPERVWALIAAWQELRSEIERDGDVEREEWVEVLDVERGLRAMASPDLRSTRQVGELKQAQSAAAAIALRMLLGWSNFEIRRVLRRGPEMDPDRLFRKACAWTAVYLSRGSFAEADEAFRKAS